MTEQSIWLPFPPSVNNLFSQGIVKRKIRRFPSKQYKAWRKQAELLLMAGRLKKYDIPVVIKLALTPRDSRARDADNYNKPIIDSLVNVGIIQGDDSRYVKAVTAYWNQPDINSGVMVFLRPANMEGKTPDLRAGERNMLARIEKRGLHLVGPRWKPGVTLQSLIQKGFVETLPGLIDDAPQGYRALEANKKIGSVS
jgi:crossover junction endodeoxyribonuclease RusA